jgi:hypothetical protein
MTRLNLSLNELTQRRGSDEADEALKELLTAIYDKDYNAATQRINTDWAKTTFGTIRAYVDAFNASLTRAGKLTVYGRIDSSEAVRFVLRGSAERGYRVSQLRKSYGRGYVLDESAPPSPIESIELSVFQLKDILGLEAAPQDGEQGTSVPLVAAENPCTPELIVRLRAVSKALFDKNRSFQNPAIDYYKNCYVVLEEGRSADYFSCFGTASGAELRSAFERLDSDRRGLFIRSELDREPAFILDGGPITVLFYRQRKESASAVLKHQIILRRDTTFELIPPLKSSSLDDLLNSQKFQTGLRKVSAHVEQ